MKSLISTTTYVRTYGVYILPKPHKGSTFGALTYYIVYTHYRPRAKFILSLIQGV